MAMILPHIKYVWNRYGQATQRNGKDAVVELRITYGKRVKYISTGVRLKHSQWRDGMVINHLDCVELNRLLEGYRKKVFDLVNDMLEEGDIDIFSIPQRMKRKEERQSLSEFIKNRMSVRAHGKSKPVQGEYKRFYEFFFDEWGRIKNFSDITDENVVALDRFLISKGMKPSSRWHNYHRFLNSYIADAINEGIISHNPYKFVNVDRGDVSDGLKKCLTPEEFARFRGVALPANLSGQRDVFVVQTYLCMAYQDLADISRKNLLNVNGKLYLHGYRGKTGIEYTKPILPEAEEILERYNYKLPVYTKTTYNRNLKLIAQAAGINKPLSSHWARHTGATLLVNIGVDMHLVSKVLGHSSTRITEKVYAKVLDKTVVDKVFDVYNNQNNIN